jgi:hypothetical protein
MNSLLSILFLSVIAAGGVVNAQQLIKIYTTNAKFHLTIPLSDPKTFTIPTQQQFQFESALSKLFHNEITHRERGANDPYANSRAVLTTVQLSEVGSDEVTTTGADTFMMNNLLNVEAVVSVVFSQVGMYKAVKRSPLTGGLEEKVAPNLASLLSEVISTDELLSTLIISGIIPENDGYSEELLKASFESFNGAFDERGMYTTGDMDIVSNSQGGWAMFWAGMFFTLVLGSAVGVGSWAYKSEHGHWPFFPNNIEGSFIGESRDIVVHTGGDDEEMMMMTDESPTKGYLGLKGHHPIISSASKENSHPNGAYRRRRIGNTHSPGSSTNDDTMSYNYENDSSPNTQVSASSKHPLGIRSMRKLNAPFFTPQKPKTKHMVLYDVERLTKSDEKSVKSNVTLFEE